MEEKNGFRVLLVEANPEKGFDYSYFIYIPNNPAKTLIIDSLNDYEPPMVYGQSENSEAMEEIYSLFNTSEIIRCSSPKLDIKVDQEEKKQTLDRMYYRLEKGINSLSNLIGINPNAPAIVPLIPGYVTDKFGEVVSQLDKGIISETAPQIKAIIEDGKRIIENETGIKLNDKVVTLGHSKSATFANNFSTYYPEMCEAAILGGGSFGTLPIDEIVLQVVENDKISDSEEFQIINGKVTKKVTKKDFDKISQEYNSTKKEYQREITINEDGTYNIPMNFPVGIADIETYRDLSDFPGGKEGYRKILASMPKMLFVGEKEDTKPGHYAYMDGKTKEGITVKAGDDILPLESKLKRFLTEIEIASMHNRVLEYVFASNILFGKSTNERLQSYMQLYSILNIPVQSKIYEGVGHCNFEYSDFADGLDGISSKSIYASKALKRDISSYYETISRGKIYQLNDTDRSAQISPVPQLIRRYLTSNNDVKFLFGISEAKIMDVLQEYISSNESLKVKNINRVYDNLSIQDLELIFLKIEKGENIPKGKKRFRGLYGRQRCKRNSSTTSSKYYKKIEY